MKSIFKKIAFVLALAMVVTAFPAMTAAAADGPQASASVKYYLGESDVAKIKTWNRTGMTRSFSVADASIATVDKATGDVTGVKVGKTTVSCEFTSKATGKVVAVTTTTVNVMRSAKEVALGAKGLEAIKFTDGKGTMQAGDSIELIKYVYRANGSIKAWGNAKTAITDSVQILTSDKSVISVTGKTVKAEAAGTATLTINARKWVGGKAKYAVTATKAYEIVVTDGIDAKATGVKEITVYGNFADDKITVKKDNRTMKGKVTLTADKTTAVVALESKLTKGTYTVIYGDQTTEIAVDDEKAVEIRVLENNGVVNTNEDRDVVYVHYDVFNQYGESVRKSFDVKWTSSTGTDVKDIEKDLGIIEIPAKGTDTFVYGSTIILTGVHTGNGNVATVNASMTVGLENSVDRVKIEGIVKKNTSVFLKETAVPAGFTDDDYLLVFSMYDRNDNIMKFDEDVAKDNLTFTSLSPLFVGAFDKDTIESKEINGVEYGAISIKRGIQAKNGGVANLLITSTKTGTSTSYGLVVESEQILASFKILSPDFIIARNDGTVTLQYEALDTEGDPVTNFRVLYKSLSFSSDLLYMVENNDMSATLKYTVDTTVKPEKNIDIPVVYTAIVPATGYSSNITLNIKADRYAASVNKYVGNKNILEGNKTTVVLYDSNDYRNHLVFADQYDDVVSWWQAWNKVPTGWYVAIKEPAEKLKVVEAGVAGLKDAVDGYKYYNVNTINLEADYESTDSILEKTVEFALADETGKIVSGSAKRVTFNIVDLNQCVGFSIGLEDNLVKNGEYKDGKGQSINWINLDGKLADGTTVSIPASLEVPDYQPVKDEKGAIVVAEQKDGTKVPVMVPTGKKVWKTFVQYNYKINAIAKGDNEKKELTGLFTNYGVSPAIVNHLPELEETSSAQFKDQSQKDAEGNNPDRKLAFEITATIFTKDIYSVSGSSILLKTYNVKDKATAKIEVGAYDKRVVTINTKAQKDAVIKATKGVITYGDITWWIDSVIDNYNDNVKDKKSVTVSISKLAEGKTGLRDADIKLVANEINIAGVMISNAEIGDTFEVTFKCEDAVKKLNFIVGSDNSAQFSKADQELNYR